MVKKVTKLLESRGWNKFTNVIFPVILVLFSLMHIGTGITITDTGYNYGNFLFFDQLDDMWKFSTYLANTMGSLFTKLPLGYTMIGLNFYTGLFKVATALCAYYFCIKVCKMRKEWVFVGEMIALGFCWCPTALIYNYLTYFLFNITAMLLYIAIVKEKPKFFILAGVVLGINLFVRLPNLAECALILVVWFAGIARKSKFKKILTDTLFCVIGYIAAVVGILGYIACKYGMGRYIKGIQEIFSMTENASSYSPMAMVVGNIKVYFDYIEWFAIGLLLAGCGVVLFKIFGKRFVWIKQMVICFAMVAFVIFLYKKGKFTAQYTEYSSMFFWGVMFLIFILGYSFYVVLNFKKDFELRLLAVMNIIFVLITPIGSNNNLFSPMNNLFLVSPIIIHSVGEMIFGKKNSIALKKIDINLFPLKMFCVTVMGMVLLQSFLFGVNFVFRDGEQGEQRIYTIENNDVLKGMHTNKKNAEELQGLNDYLTENGLIGEEVILFGEIPAAAYYFSLEPAISSTWPDLASFQSQKFCQEIDVVEKEGKTPMVIVNGLNAINIHAYAEVEEVQSEWEKKVKRLQLFLYDNNYEQSYVSEGYVVYQKAD